jgi:hypothetical protein
MHGRIANRELQPDARWKWEIGGDSGARMGVALVFVARGITSMEVQPDADGEYETCKD